MCKFKKIILALLFAATLVACNEKPSKVVDGSIEENSTPETATQNNVEKNAIDELVEKGEAIAYTPTGDINKDAQALVDKQLELALLEADGKSNETLKKEVTFMLIKLGEYYSNNNKQEEFQQALGEKMKEGINRIKKEGL